MQARRARHPALLVAAIAIAAVASGCNGVLPFGSAGDASANQAPDRVHQQANDALQRWADAVKQSGGASITFVGTLTSQVGDWESAVAGNDKVALQAGAVTAQAALSEDVPDRQKVSWVDGTSIDVNMLSASKALEDLVADGSGTCGGCSPLLVTGASLATSLAQTSNGAAQVPVWVFTLKGTAVTITRVAVDPSVTVNPPPFNAGNPPDGISIDAAFGQPGSRKLTVTFVGGCGAAYSADAVESDLAVVAVVEEVPGTRDSGGCDLVGHSMTKILNLVDPLGKRAVLEVRQGLPVPLNPS